ncbi:MAG: hypothetical protein K2N56_11865 [Oscillospiraceae bacterium]|nr:hypothetical protein [Oscillospiraceae bacterium]
MEGSRFQKYAAVYLVINALFILPAIFISFAGSFTFFFPINIYFIVVLFYYVFGFTFLHLALDVGFMLCSIRRFVKERMSFMLVASMLIVVINTAVNILWILRGKPFTIQ